MAIFNSYVKLPEGIEKNLRFFKLWIDGPQKTNKLRFAAPTGHFSDRYHCFMGLNKNFKDFTHTNMSLIS
jgi:hypothetical protein